MFHSLLNRSIAGRKATSLSPPRGPVGKEHMGQDETAFSSNVEPDGNRTFNELAGCS